MQLGNKSDSAKQDGAGRDPRSRRRLISADRVQGTPVFDREGEQIGHVEDVMLDKESGKVAYAIMSHGGLLGAGERYHPLPWKVLSYDTRVGGYVVDLDKHQLDTAPSYAAEESPWSDPKYGERIYDYYGIPYPYYI